jgi:hypothetical protein
MKTKFKSAFRAVHRSLSIVVCAGAILLLAANEQAQNLFVSFPNNRMITEFTPGGTQSISDSIFGAQGLTFDSGGNLFVSSQGGTITKITPGGVSSTVISGRFNFHGLTFNSAGDLFVVDQLSDTIFEITPGGAQSSFASVGQNLNERKTL